MGSEWEVGVALEDGGSGGGVGREGGEAWLGEEVEWMGKMESRG